MKLRDYFSEYEEQGKDAILSLLLLKHYTEDTTSIKARKKQNKTKILKVSQI
jgi:hypothetical protein